MIGKRLNHYEVLDQLGEGGMGTVYRARDTRLQRDVALKVLAEGFVQDPERMARFEREAQILAAFSHPGIAQVYGFEEDQGVRFLVMELVPGEDLAQRLERGRLSVEDAIGVARQVAEALEAAHEAGIIHRDLKPQNIRITPEDGVKVLDFGLAKALEGDPAAGSSPNLSQSPTLTGMLTSANVILGTAAYMSPEQARGKPVDRRADIWAFGVVLFEMLTGDQAFPGDTVSDILASVLKTEPDRTALPPDTPPALRRLLERCLDKSVRTRLRDIGEARILLSGGIEAGPDADAMPVAPVGRRVVFWVAVVGAVLIAAAFWTGRLGRTTSRPDPLYVELQAPEVAPFYSRFDLGSMAVSPDGKQLVFSAEDSTGSDCLWIRPFDSPAAYRLDGTEKGYFPFWSPDSRYVAYFANNTLWRIEARGGAPLALCPAQGGRGGSWGEDGTILSALGSGTALSRIPSAGGTPVPATRLAAGIRGDDSHRWPCFLPGGDRFLYATYSGENEVFVGSLSDTTLRVALPGVQGNVAYDNGRLFFIRAGTLVSQAFDPDDLSLEGPVSVVDPDVVFVENFLRSPYTVAGGTLVLGHAPRSLFQAGLAEYDPSGTLTDRVEFAGRLDDLAVSPDGRRVAVAVITKDGIDVWSYDRTRRLQTRVSFDQEADDPTWSPDNRTLAFADSGNLHIKPFDGTGRSQELHRDGTDHVINDWSQDGRYIFYCTGSGSKEQVYVYDREDGEARKLLEGDFRYVTAQQSPDGEWLAYGSNESGEMQVYIQDFPGLQRRIQISSVPGSMPVWSPDGQRMYYVDREGNIRRVTLARNGTDLEVTTDQVLFKTNISHQFRTLQFGITPDEERFLVLEQEDRRVREAPVLKAVFNWRPPDD